MRWRNEDGRILSIGSRQTRAEADELVAEETTPPWKVQYLDLSELASGTFRREERFGYLRMAAHPDLEPRDLIRCEKSGGKVSVTFSTEQGYDLITGTELEIDDF